MHIRLRAELGGRLPGATASLLALCIFFGAGTAAAQDAGHRDPVAEAERLHAARDFAGAVRVLRPHVEKYADDVDAARLLARSLYWTGDRAAARNSYELAISRHPANHALRLDYGRMLLETGDHRRMRQVIAPAFSAASSRSEAHALTGTAAYWQGDLSSATRSFREALRVDPSRTDARTRLLEIADLTAPWMRLVVGAARDDQPLERGSVGLEAGWHPRSLTALSARYQSGRLTSGDSIVVTTMSGEVGISHYSPSSRIEMEAVGGFAHLGREQPADWTGRAGAGLRLPKRVAVRGRGERFVSLYTLASLDTAIIGHAAVASAEWNTARGWLAEAGVRREWYADANAISAAHAWVLAPLVSRPAVTLQAGYGLNAQHADESRYLADGTSGAGRYTPYYTPLALRAHSLLGAAMLRLTSRLALRGSGSLGLRADEQIPGATSGGGAPVRGGPVIGLPGGGGGGGEGVDAARRSFSPWTARAGLDITPTPGFALSLGGEAMHTAFYTSGSASLRATWRFGGIARRNAERGIRPPAARP